MGPVEPEELVYLKERGVGAVVRLEWRTISAEEAGLVDLAGRSPYQIRKPPLSVG